MTTSEPRPTDAGDASGTDPRSPARVRRGGPLLEVTDLTVRFGTEDGVVNAVRGVSYSLAEREVLGIVGESGSGKSVSSLAVMGLLPRSARVTGQILLDGEDVVAMSERQRRSIRGRRVAMIFQDPMTALNPVYSVGDQLAESVRSHEAVSKKIALGRAVEMLDLVGIPRPKERLKAYPHEFSGGMRQRVMIAMAVINRPDVIIADEPTTALDVTVQAQILEKLVEVKDAVNAAIVLITHDLGVVAGMADRVLVMYAGRAVERGTTTDVFRRPRMPYTAGLLGSIPSLEVAGGRLRPIPGAPPSLINLPPGCPFSPRCPIVQDVCQGSEPPLEETDRRGHDAACHYWSKLADLPDPTALFRAQSVEASTVEVPAVEAS
jgi:peptide/nickel transport system ATP-binding protein